MMDITQAEKVLSRFRDFVATEPPSIKGTEMFDAIQAVLRERERLQRERDEAVAKTKGTYCAYCGHEEPVDGDGITTEQENVDEGSDRYATADDTQPTGVRDQITDEILTAEDATERLNRFKSQSIRRRDTLAAVRAAHDTLSSKVADLEVQLRSKEVEVWEAHVSETEAIKDLNDVCADYSRLVMRAAAINLDKAKAACEGDEPEEKSDG